LGIGDWGLGIGPNPHYKYFFIIKKFIKLNKKEFIIFFKNYKFILKRQKKLKNC